MEGGKNDRALDLVGLVEWWGSGKRVNGGGKVGGRGQKGRRKTRKEEDTKATAQQIGRAHV